MQDVHQRMSIVRGNSMLSADHIGKYFHHQVDRCRSSTNSDSRSQFSYNNNIRDILHITAKNTPAISTSPHERTDARLGAPTLLRVKKSYFLEGH